MTTRFSGGPNVVRALFLTTVLGGTMGLMAPLASAGECPADKGTTDGQKPGTTASKDVTDTVIASIDLNDEAPHLKDTKFRLRKLVIQPGGIVAWHSSPSVQRSSTSSPARSRNTPARVRFRSCTSRVTWRAKRTRPRTGGRTRPASRSFCCRPTSCTTRWTNIRCERSCCRLKRVRQQGVSSSVLLRTRSFSR